MVLRKVLRTIEPDFFSGPASVPSFVARFASRIRPCILLPAVRIAARVERADPRKDVGCLEHPSSFEIARTVVESSPPERRITAVLVSDITGGIA